MNALTLAIRLVKLGLLPGIDFIGNGNDVAMTESGARTLDTYTRFYIHTLPAGEQVQQLLSVKRTLEEEITLAEKGAVAMNELAGGASRTVLNHSLHVNLKLDEADKQLLAQVCESTQRISTKVLTPSAVEPEPIGELIYSTKHLEQPTGRHPDLMTQREVDLFVGIEPGKDSVLTSDVRTDRGVTRVREGVGKTREIDTTKGGVELARKLVDMTPGWHRSAPKPEPTGRTSLVGNRFTGESERRYPHGHPLDFLIGELHTLLAINDKRAILEYYREYLGTRDKPMFLRLRRAQQVRSAKRALNKMLSDTRETRKQSIEKAFGLKPGSFGV